MRAQESGRAAWFLAVVMILALAQCSGQLGTTSVGGCMAGERQRLSEAGTLVTPGGGVVTVTAPIGTNFAVCAW